MRPYEGLAAYYDLLYQQGVGIDYAEQARDLVRQIHAWAPRARTPESAGFGEKSVGHAPASAGFGEKSVAAAAAAARA